MASNHIKLIVTDLDDTFLRRDKVISERAKSVLERCRERGILVAIATARTEKVAERFSRQINPEVIISDMGALARRGSQVLFKAPIPPDVFPVLLQRCLNDARVLHITLQAENGYFSSRPFDGAGWEDYAHSVTTDLSKLADHGDIYRITIKMEGNETPQAIIDGFPTVCATSFRYENWHSLHALNTSKESALRAVAGVLNIPIENVASFGDDTSDIGMLCAAGIGVAVQNAIPEVKAAADYVCGDCDDDGVVKWIEENIL